MSGKPILVTGTHRSGTTWTGTLLSLSGEALPIHEPFNPADPRSWLAERPRRWFEYVDEPATEAWTQQMHDVLALRPPVGIIIRRQPRPRHVVRVLQEGIAAAKGRRHGARPLLKDPIAFFSAEWLATSFESDILVLIRHPAAFAGSLKRLDWDFDFRNLTSQPRLMDGPLAGCAGEVWAAARADLDIIGAAIALWRVVNSVALDYRAKHPTWVVRRYEDLATDPIRAFRRLYGELGLTWSPTVETGVGRHSGHDNVSDVAHGDKGGVIRDSSAAMWTWAERLTPDEVARIRCGTDDIAAEFYSDQDWQPPRIA